MRWDFIQEALRTAPGSQYLVDLADIKKQKTNVVFKARVKAQTPAVMPAVDLVGSIAQATVNGKPWHYFEDHRLYLPKTEGTYEISVRLGEPDAPYLIGTQAIVSDMDWDGRTFRFKTGFPKYTKKLPRSVHFYAAINRGRFKSAKITGAQCVSEGGDVLVIKFKRGLVKVDFDES